MSKPKPDTFLPLKSNWFHILICLVEGEQHGYGIMQDVLERSGGKVRLWPATLYGSLKRLIEKGLITRHELDEALELQHRQNITLQNTLAEIQQAPGKD